MAGRPKKSITAKLGIPALILKDGPRAIIYGRVWNEPDRGVELILLDSDQIRLVIYKLTAMLNQR